MDIKFVKIEDKEFWYSLDKHLPESEFEKKVRDNQGYVLFDKDAPIGILRYNLFWDNTPFCTLLFICEERQKQGCGRMLMEHWEEDMKRLGYQMVMTSTRIDEEAQHFYRKLGYIDCGNLTIDYPGLAQPLELLLSKAL